MSLGEFVGVGMVEKEAAILAMRRCQDKKVTLVYSQGVPLDLDGWRVIGVPMLYRPILSIAKFLGFTIRLPVSVGASDEGLYRLEWQGPNPFISRADAMLMLLSIRMSASLFASMVRDVVYHDEPNMTQFSFAELVRYNNVFAEMEKSRVVHWKEVFGKTGGRDWFVQGDAQGGIPSPL